MNTGLAAQRALDRLAKAGFDSLSELEKILAAVWLFEAGVGNDGVIGYFSSGREDLAFYGPLREALSPCRVDNREMRAARVGASIVH